ncbi:MAG: response regulator, partial [Myxococcota bacterium]
MPPDPKRPAFDIDTDGFSIDEDEDAAVNAGPPGFPAADGLMFDDILAESPPQPVGAPAPADDALDFDPFGASASAPRRAPTPPPPPPPPAAELSMAGGVVLGAPLRVLLAGAAAAMYRNAVATSGYDVTVVESGVEALSGLDTLSPDLVVTTLDLGDLSGLELMKAAQAVHPSVRFILVDDPSFPQQIVAALGEGAVAFVPAGSPGERLLIAIREAEQREISRREGKRAPPPAAAPPPPPPPAPRAAPPAPPRAPVPQTVS